MPKKILIIDDDTRQTKMMCLVLEKEGFTVYHAQDGTSGLAKLRSLKPDIIILDIRLGGCDEGFHVAYEIKNDENLKELPIIIISDDVQEKECDFHFQMDFDLIPVNGYLEKPFNPEKLIEIVKINLDF